MTTPLSNQTRNILTIAVLAIILLIAGVGYFKLTSNYESKLVARDKLNNALNAKMVVVVDDNGKLRHDKLTLQATQKELLDRNDRLSNNQKELVSYVKEVSKRSDIIAAGLVDMKVQIAKLSIKKPTAETDSSVVFTQESDSINFVAKVNNVKALAGKTPTLDIIDLKIPNKLLLDFQWGKKKDGSAVSFSVTNSNPLFKVNDIDSYIIPEIVIDKVKPNFWQKTKLFIGGKLVPVLIGVGVGVGVIAIILL